MTKFTVKVKKLRIFISHYRRFIDPNNLKRVIKFEITYFKESKNLAKYKKENPCNEINSKEKIDQNF